MSDEYKWRDLRKNPNDYPNEEYETVEVWLDNDCVDIAVYCKEYGFRPWYSAYFEECTPEWESSPVIGWRYIEPFRVWRTERT